MLSGRMMLVQTPSVYENRLFMSILLTPLLQYAPATEDIIAALLFHVLSYVT